MRDVFTPHVVSFVARLVPGPQRPWRTQHVTDCHCASARLPCPPRALQQWCLSAKQSESQARLERLRQAGDSAATCVFENNYSAIAKLRAMQASGAACEHIVRLRAVIELVVQPDQARGEDAAHCPCAHLVAVLQGASGGELWDYCPALPGPLSVRDAMLLFEQVMTGAPPRVPSQLRGFQLQCFCV